MNISDRVDKHVDYAGKIRFSHSINGRACFEGSTAIQQFLISIRAWEYDSTPKNRFILIEVVRNGKRHHRHITNYPRPLTERGLVILARRFGREIIRQEKKQ